jgi:hypothetical protein
MSAPNGKVLCAFHADDDLALDIDDAKDWFSQNPVSVKFSRAGTLRALVKRGLADLRRERKERLVKQCLAEREVEKEAQS